jgi:outer membrane protein assembly factor BamB
MGASVRSAMQEDFVRLSIRLPALATVVIAGLAPAAALASGPARAGTATAAAQSPIWVNHQDVRTGGINTQVAASPDGSAVFVAGQMNKRPGVAEAVLRAYNPATGAPLWQQKYTATARSLFGPVAVSPDSTTVFATGRAQATSRSAANYLTVAYNAVTGAQVWADNSGPQGSAVAIAVSPGGSTVFVTGAAGTVAYNAATGATLWSAAGSAAIAVAHDGSAVYLTAGLALGSRGSRAAYLTTALDAATGDTLWSEQYDVPKGSSVPVAIAATSTGSAVIVTGTTRDATGTVVNFGTVAYNPVTGARLWVRAYHNPSGLSSARTLVISPDGSRAFVTGTTGGSSNPIFYGDYATVAYNTATGAPLWTARYRGPASGFGGPAEDVTVSPDGATVVVTGYNWSASPGSQPQFATVAYDSGTGAQLWAARYGQPAIAPAYGVSVAVSPDSAQVFVTGDTGNDGTTIAYNS